MDKKKKLLNKSKILYTSKKFIDLSLLHNKIKIELSSNLDIKLRKLGKFDNSIIFRNHFFDEKLKEIYNKKQRRYLNNTNINRNILLMLHNYISLTKIIQNKKDIFEKLLNIINYLLLNEIEFAYMTLILDKINWININKDITKNLFYIGLAIKTKIFPDNNLLILNEIENNYNNKFTDNFNEWINKSDIIKILQNNTSKIEERFRILRKPIYIKKEEKCFINYNEIATKIAQNTNDKIQIIDKDLISKINYNSNINNDIKNISNLWIKSIDRKDNLYFQSSFLKKEELLEENPIRKSKLQKEMESFYSLDLNNNYFYKIEDCNDGDIRKYI